MKELYDVQKKHQICLVNALNKYNVALDGSATGTGKTLTAAQLAADSKRPTLVVGLKSTLPFWREELKDRGVSPLDVINYELLRRGKNKYGRWVGKNMWEFNLPKNALIIFDEVQRCQGLHSQNSYMLIGAKPYQTLMLSATAAEDPTEMRALGYLLRLHNIRDFWRWCKANGCVPNPWGGLDFEGGHEIINKIHHQIFPEKGHRLSLEDMAEHFQETQIVTTPLEFGKEIEKIYAEMEKELDNLAEIMTSDSSHPAAAALVAQLRARQKVELCKVPAIIEMTEDLIKEGRSIAIFVNFDATIEALNGRFGCKTAIIRGGQTDRQENIDAFQNNQAQVVICNIQAGGVSVSLHDLHGSHPRTSIISPSWNAKDIIQTLGRVHRAGGKSPSQQHILFAANTVEEKVEQVVRDKMRHIEIFNEGKKKVVPKERVCHNEITVSTEESAEHANYNPSSMSNFELCPGFRNRQNTNAAAERGTRIHKALQKGEIDALPDEEEKHLAQQIQDFVDSIIAEHRPAIPKDYREIRLNMDLGGGLTTFGTGDRLLIYETKGIFLDYKTGALEVADAEHNAQGWCYVIGAFQKFPELQEITFWFLVPTRDEAFYHTFKRSDMPKMILRINTIIRRAMEANPDLFNPQPELCEYCARQASCPALAAKALAVASKLAPGLPIPQSVTVDASKPDDIPHLLRLAPLMEAWASGVREDALKVNLEKGVDIPGFMRVERSTPRAVTSVLGAWRILEDKGISLEDFLAACSKVSVPELEDMITSRAKRGEKGKAWQTVEDELRHADVMKNEGNIYYLREKKK